MYKCEISQVKSEMIPILNAVRVILVQGPYHGMSALQNVSEKHRKTTNEHVHIDGYIIHNPDWGFCGKPSLFCQSQITKIN